VRLETILNKVHPLKSFVYRKSGYEMIGGRKTIVVDIIPRGNGIPRCSVCGSRAPLYDRGGHERLFKFVPLWNTPSYLRYTRRRVQCATHGVRVEWIPWSEGNSHLTKAFRIFLAGWARRLSWAETARFFQATWDDVFRSVKYVVEWGLAHRSLDGVTAIGVDEVQFGKGHNYITVVYQLDAAARRLLYVGQDRTAKCLLRFFFKFGRERCAALKFVCSDMWKPYLKVIRKMAPQALNILDRFHIVQHMGKAIDKVRAEEVRQMKEKGYDSESLKHTKYCFLKNEENLSDKQRDRLDSVLKLGLKSVRAYLLKESFRLFWQYKSPYWAEWYLEKWCARAMRSRLEPIKQFVKMVRKHQPLIMNWFKAKKAFSSGIVEGLNRKLNLVTRKAFGFRSYEVLEIALFHTLGKLPEPESTHKFC
jgi:transposase